MFGKHTGSTVKLNFHNFDYIIAPIALAKKCIEDSIWGANEAKHHACLREQTEST